ncbi:LacI family DNA-binding transcriptional regulator [Paraburkholderia sp. Se-20369]|nr:LacI family DNA-binding transcriptional regulator [Paraburkholderia sp. Se-20369]
MTDRQKKQWVTASDVAARAGVSRSAVSRAFSPTASIAPETRERVMHAARALGYQVNLIARDMITQRSSMIGVVTAGFENPFRARLLSDLLAALGHHALTPLVTNAEDPRQIRQSLERLLSYRIAGLVMTSASPPLSVALTQATNALDDFQAARGKEVFDTAQMYYSWLRAGAVAGIAFGLAACLGCAIGLHFAISQPVERLLEHFRRLSGGDLTSEVRWSSQDEMAELVKGVTGMQRNLVDTVRQVTQGSEAIVTATHQIAAGNTDLSQRTEEQAASLEQTAASMEQLTATVKQNADNAAQAQACADSASDIASKGAAVVSEVVDTMNEIDQSSQKVADIIGTIEGIAFQTNILALNAAVEAARAGEQGRGFAVVAGEVRTLAQRSASAAKEIRTLIGESVERVANGSRLVGVAGSTMQDIQQAISRVTGIMAEIAAASNEQRDGIEQVNLAVSQMDQVSQQNAALVEEAAAAAASLEEQADVLRRAVGAFRVA